jgi:sporulation protein YlmC with PRC-barrel domain
MRIIDDYRIQNDFNYDTGNTDLEITTQNGQYLGTIPDMDEDGDDDEILSLIYELEEVDDVEDENDWA